MKKQRDPMVGSRRSKERRQSSFGGEAEKTGRRGKTEEEDKD